MRTTRIDTTAPVDRPPPTRYGPRHPKAQGRPRPPARRAPSGPVPMPGGPLIEHRAAWKTVVAYLVGALIIVPMAGPVLDSLNVAPAPGGLSFQERLRPASLGPVSGLMLYVFLTPVLVALPTRLRAKLAVIGATLSLALVLSHITTVFERGDLGTGLALSWLALVSVAGVASLALWQHRTRRAAVQRSAAGLARLVRETAAEVPAPAAAGGAGPDTDAEDREGPSIVRLVETMALGAIWQTAVAGPPETFEARLLREFAEIRRDLAGNRALDPLGQGQVVMERLLSRARHRLRPSPAPPRPDGG